MISRDNTVQLTHIKITSWMHGFLLFIVDFYLGKHFARGEWLLLFINFEHSVCKLSSRVYMVNYERVIAQETCLVALTGFSYIWSLQSFRGGKLEMHVKDIYQCPCVLVYRLFHLQLWIFNFMRIKSLFLGTFLFRAFRNLDGICRFTNFYFC